MASSVAEDDEADIKAHVTLVLRRRHDPPPSPTDDEPTSASASASPPVPPPYVPRPPVLEVLRMANHVPLADTLAATGCGIVSAVFKLGTQANKCLADADADAAQTAAEEANGYPDVDVEERRRLKAQANLPDLDRLLGITLAAPFVPTPTASAPLSTTVGPTVGPTVGVCLAINDLIDPNAISTSAPSAASSSSSSSAASSAQATVRSDYHRYRRPKPSATANATPDPSADADCDAYVGTTGDGDAESDALIGNMVGFAGPAAVMAGEEQADDDDSTRAVLDGLRLTAIVDVSGRVSSISTDAYGGIGRSASFPHPPSIPSYTPPFPFPLSFLPKPLPISHLPTHACRAFRSPLWTRVYSPTRLS